MSYKTYQEYKNSNNIWAGDVPTHWELHKIKNLIFFQEGPGLRNWQFTDNGVRVICVTNITSNGIDFSNYEKFISEDEYKQIYSHFTVNQGDLLLSSSGNSWGKVAEYNSDETVILNTSTIRINKNPTSDYELEQPYIKWALQSEYIREQLGLMMTGSCQPNFGPTHLAKISILMPSIEEQKQIANFLDKKTAKIDATIAKNEELIQLLEEKRVALINQVVTKGLNPDVPMKDSGVEWIGEIPEHWSVDNLNHYVTVTKLAGFEFTEYMEYVDDGEIIALRGLNIKNNQLDLSNIVKITKEVSDKLPRSKLYKNDIILSYVGTIGEAAIIDKDDTYHLAPNIAKISKKSDKINIKYLLYYISSDSGQKEISLKTSKTSQEVISMAKIRKIKIVTPTIDEQNIIANYLEKEILKINKIISKVNNTINLLEEYKTSLIHHVVTGKIDVRGEQIE